MVLHLLSQLVIIVEGIESLSNRIRILSTTQSLQSLSTHVQTLYQSSHTSRLTLQVAISLTVAFIVNGEQISGRCSDFAQLSNSSSQSSIVLQYVKLILSLPLCLCTFLSNILHPRLTVVLSDNSYQLSIQLCILELRFLVLIDSCTTSLNGIIVIVAKSNVINQFCTALLKQFNSTIALRRRGVLSLLSLNLGNSLVQGSLSRTVITLTSIVLLSLLSLLKSLVDSDCLNNTERSGDISKLHVSEQELVPSLTGVLTVNIVSYHEAQFVITSNGRSELNGISR